MPSASEDNSSQNSVEKGPRGAPTIEAAGELYRPDLDDPLRHTIFDDAEQDPNFSKPSEGYEGLHRWDPYFQWTLEEEKKIVRKVCIIDTRYIPPGLELIHHLHRLIGVSVQ